MFSIGDLVDAKIYGQGIVQKSDERITAILVISDGNAEKYKFWTKDLTLVEEPELDSIADDLSIRFLVYTLKRDMAVF